MYQYISTSFVYFCIALATFSIGSEALDTSFIHRFFYKTVDGANDNGSTDIGVSNNNYQQKLTNEY